MIARFGHGCKGRAADTAASTGLVRLVVAGCRLQIPSTALQPKSIRGVYHATRLVRSLRCNARRHPSGILRGPVAHPGPHHFSYSAAAGSIDGNRKGWLQQTAAHSRNRIREWRHLSLSRCASGSASRSDVGRVKSAILRLQHQRALSIRSDSTAAKATSAHEITRPRRRPWRNSSPIESKNLTRKNCSP